MSAARSMRRRSLGLAARHGDLGGEELAAVLVGEGWRSRRCRAAWADLHDLRLVAVDQRAQERQLRRPPSTKCEVRQRLTTPPVRASRPLTSASALSRRPSSEATLSISRRCDSTWSRTVSHAVASRRWAGPNETTNRREPPWKRSSRPAERVGLVDRLGTGEGPPAEVDEVTAQPASSSSGRRPPASRGPPRAARARARSSPPGARRRRAGGRRTRAAPLESTSTYRHEVGIQPGPRRRPSTNPDRIADPRADRSIERSGKRLVSPRTSGSRRVSTGAATQKRPPPRRHHHGSIALAAQRRLNHAHARAAARQRSTRASWGATGSPVTISTPPRWRHSRSEAEVGGEPAAGCARARSTKQRAVAPLQRELAEL